MCTIHDPSMGMHKMQGWMITVMERLYNHHKHNITGPKTTDKQRKLTQGNDNEKPKKWQHQDPNFTIFLPLHLLLVKRHPPNFVLKNTTNTFYLPLAPWTFPFSNIASVPVITAFSTTKTIPIRKYNQPISIHNIKDLNSTPWYKDAYFESLCTAEFYAFKYNGVFYAISFF